MISRQLDENNDVGHSSVMVNKENYMRKASSFEKTLLISLDKKSSRIETV